MVELFAAERKATMTRLSFDADALADARERPNVVQRVSEILVDQGFRLEEPSYFGVGHVFRRGDVEIDVLAPEGLGERSEARRRTVSPAHTVEVPGGTQALRRTELVEIEVGGRRGKLPRPNLLGAILVKARAVAIDDAPDSQRADLALLLSLVENPDGLAGEVSPSERRWLRRRREMSDEAAPWWRPMSADARQQGVAAFRILADL